MATPSGAGKDKRPSANVPYWITGGPDICAGCGLPHVREVEFRCVVCDHGVCHHCVVVVWEAREAFCLGCRDAEEEEEG